MLAIVEEAAVRVEVIYVICNSEPAEVPAPSEPINAPPIIPIIGCPLLLRPTDYFAVAPIRK